MHLHVATNALLAAVESLLSAVVTDGMSGDKHNFNVELIAQGIANLGCPRFGGIPAKGYRVDGEGSAARFRARN